MGQQSHPTTPFKYGVFIFFLFCSLAAFVWFGWSIASLSVQMWTNAPVVALNKGAMYMLGVGLASAALSVAIFQEAIIGRTMTARLAQRVTRSALAGLIIIFLLPYVIHGVVEHNLGGRGYEICEKASYQWLLYRKIVYVSSPELCAELEMDKN